MVNAENIIEVKSVQLLEQAIQYGASDIHFFPQTEHYTIHFQKSGELHEMTQYPRALSSRMISYFKFMSELDITETRRPQSGSFFKAFGENQYSFRVSTMPAMHKESVVVRIQKEDAVISFKHLFLENEWRQQMERVLNLKQGLIAITGPTGCGKTTTMYACTSHCVKHLNRHVITLEDPVEREVKDVLQVQVNERFGFTYDAGLKAILRHSPDVIMLGEIRDRYAAETAVRAALSGHLVLTTVHSKDLLGVLYRLLDLRVTREQLEQTIVAILTQRLIDDPMTERRQAVFQIATEEKLERLFSLLKAGERDDAETIEDVVRRYTKEKRALS